jgi:hypothetical protein
MHNKGLSDQMVPSFKLNFGPNVKVLSNDGQFLVKNMKKRSEQIEQVPV